MGNRKNYFIENIVEICHKLDRKGFVANHDGNVSVRFENGFLCTPTSESKAAIRKEMILTLDQEGKKIEGIGKPFSEMQLHLAAYAAREDAVAVVHAHPPFATARGLIGEPLTVTLPEAVISIGDFIPVAPFVMPGAPENLKVIRDALEVSDVFMMAGNGVLAIGKDLEQAYLRLELLEHIAKIEFYVASYAANRGVPMQLSEEDKNILLEKRAALGLGPKRFHIPVVAAPAHASGPDLSNLQEIIAQEIRKVLLDKN